MNDTPQQPELRGTMAERSLGQGLIALGQGTAGVRVSLDAVGLAQTVCGPILQEVGERWPQYVDAALEVVRTIGRVAAQLATEHGKTEIEASHLLWAAALVTYERTSFPCLLIKKQLVRLGYTNVSRPEPRFQGPIRLEG